MESQRLENLEREVRVLQERNQRVEAEKAWETSYVRMSFIALITYVVAVGILYFLGAEKIFLGAVVPAAGYVLSTQSLPALREWWIRRSERSGNTTRSLFS